MAERDPLNRTNHFGSQPMTSVRGLQQALKAKQDADPKLDALANAGMIAADEQIPVFVGERVVMKKVGHNPGDLIDGNVLGRALASVRGGATINDTVADDEAQAAIVTRSAAKIGELIQDALDGIEGGGGGTVGELSAAPYDTLADANAAAAAGPYTLTLPAGDYAIASDLTFSAQVRFADGAKLIPAAGVNIHFEQGFIADDWNHCFDISAAGSSITGDRAPRGHYTPLQFGADPTDTAVDDRPAIEAATEFGTLQPIRTEYAHGFPVKFPHPGSGNYYLTKTRPIYIARTTHWFGDTRIYLRDYGGVEIRAADGLDAVALAFMPGGNTAPNEYEPANDPGAAIPGIGKDYSAIRSRFSDLSFLPESGAVVRNGFVHNCMVYLDRCVASGFTEAQFHAHAQTSGSMVNIFAHPGINNVGNTNHAVPASTMAYDGTGAVFGNANGSIYTGCYGPNGVAAAGRNGGAHGFVAHGNNAGTIKYIGCDGNGNQGVGFLENSSIGCEYFANHSAQNCFDVSHNGVVYLPIKYHVADAASEPGVGANWRSYWAINTSATGDAAWALGQAYHPSGGVNISDFGSRSSVLAHYSEGGIEVGIIARARTYVAGGNGVERAPWHGEFNTAKVEVDSSLKAASAVGYEGERTPGDAATAYAISLGAPNAYTGGTLLEFGDAQDNPTSYINRITLTFNTARKAYLAANRDSAGKYLFGVPGSSFSNNGRTGSAAGFLAPCGIIIGDRSASMSRAARIMAALNLADITDAKFGAVATGDVWYYSAPVAGGKVGAVCTTAGTIGSGAVIKEFGAIDA